VHDWELELDIEAGGDLVYQTTGFLVMDVTVGVEPEEAVVPSELSLGNVYPNPFNNRATLKYILARNGAYELNLYSLDGKLMQIIVSGQGSVGEYIVPIDGEGLSAGVYILRLTQAEVIATRKVVLVK
jgi:rhamnogalacturonan endolyase